MWKFFLLHLVKKCGDWGRRIYWYAVYQSFREKYDIDPSFAFNGHGIQLYGNGTLVLGRGSYIGELSTIQAFDGCRVEVGIGCQISHNVRIYTQSTVPDHDFSVKPLPSKLGNVVVRDHCWIGANVLINPGVTIGPDAVVGANSVVTQDVPEKEIWGGVPARLIRMKRAL